jgi:hypothetical protein
MRRESTVDIGTTKVLIGGVVVGWYQEWVEMCRWLRVRTAKQTCQGKSYRGSDCNTYIHRTVGQMERIADNNLCNT